MYYEWIDYNKVIEILNFFYTNGLLLYIHIGILQSY